MPATLIVAHSSGAERSALVDLLWRNPNLQVVNQTATFEGVLDLVEMRKPDAVVIEFSLIPADKVLRSGSKQEGVKPLKALLGCEVVAVTVRADDSRQLAERLGVAALLERNRVRESLVETVLSVTGSRRRGAAPS
jgi:DNA-binding NarL/FixJ family response regulator